MTFLKRRKIALLLALALSAGLAHSAETLVFCSEASPDGLNPQLFTTGTVNDATAETFYSRLTQFDIATTKLDPKRGLAEKIDISDDGLVYTFSLRKGVAFHSNKLFKPTRELNADDVVFSIERQRDANHPYHKVSGGTYEYFTSMGMDKSIKSVEKVDDHTVKITLNYPDSPFLANLAMAHSSILSAEYADVLMKAGTPEKIDLNPIGTGPFQFVTYKKDANIRYKAFEQYWLGVQPIKNLVFSITLDPSVRFAKLQKNECQVTLYPNPADIPAMKSDPNITVLEQPGLNIGYLAFNTLKKPFDNKKVRQALNMAVNKAAIIDAVYQGSGVMAKNPMPPTIWSYNDAIEDYQYDVDKAKALLKEAGFENGFETDLWAMPVQRPYNPNARRMAEMIQSDWAKVGVKAKIVSFEWAEYLKRAKAGEHQTVLLGWTGDNGDPDNFLATLLSCDAAKQGANYAQWCHAEYDEIVRKARQISDMAERTKMYEQAQVIFHEEAPWITIAHSNTFQPIRKEVTGFKVSPLGRNAFIGVDIK